MHVYDIPNYDDPHFTKIVLPKVIPEGDSGDGWLTFSVRSHENPFKRYMVAICTAQGEWNGCCTCNCMDFQCRRRKYWPSVLEGCKHCVGVIEAAYEGENE